MKLRNYQIDMTNKVYESWAANIRNVMAILPTGAGKTVLFANIIAQFTGAICAIAHRQELVGQISLALAKYGVRHKIIAPDNVIRFIVRIHMEEFGRSFYDSNSNVAVAGVDTMNSRGKEYESWFKQVRLVVIDEAHHVLTTNKWGRAVLSFPNAVMLGVTATPIRADGRGLGRHADGLIDVMHEGPTMRELIDAGYLTDYVLFAPESDLDLSDVNVTASGDYSPEKLKAAIKRSSVVGDAVTQYTKIAPGKLGVTFVTDVETATEVAQGYRDAGVPAEVVSAKTPSASRVEIIRRFRRRELLQLVNVDLFGEGFDLPAIEVISMCRPTESFALYAQQFGRALRIMEGKDKAVIIDHVGNWVRHGLPDRKRVWSLDRRDRRSRSGPTDTLPVRSCGMCTAVYERCLNACPICGYVYVPQVRSGPDQVDGDLIQIDPQYLAALRGEIARIDEDPLRVKERMLYAGAPPIAAAGAMKQHCLRQETQRALRETIAWWAGIQKSKGMSDSEMYKRFYHRYGMDVLEAQTLGRTEATQLAKHIMDEMGDMVNEIRTMGTALGSIGTSR